MDILVWIGMIFGAFCGFKFASKFTWIGSPKGIVGKYFGYMAAGAMVGGLIMWSIVSK